MAADVIALYPNINRNTLRDALTTALNLQSQFCALGQRYFVELIMLILESVIIQHGQHFYKQSNGIITGDNHSVSLANIAMHFATTPAFPILKKAVIYKRFIDDIIFIAIGENSTQNIIKAIENSLGKVGLQITTKLFNTKCSDQQVEFLDVLHKHSSDSPFKFVTSNYVKKTALDRTFINGALYHPLWVFQSIVVSEAMRMRRICEDKTDYDTSLEYLKNKCFKSKFPKTLTSKIIEQAKSWVDRFHSINNSKLKKNKQKKIVWVTQFPKLLRSSQMEKRLQSNVMLAYKCPQTLGNFVARYKKLSFGPLEGKDGGIFGPCGKCALCGNHGSHNSMVPLMKHIRTPNGVRPLTQTLNCKDYGIYAACCKNCDNYYVGQTMTSFSQRWTKHRVLWNKFHYSENNDNSALLRHYDKHHKEIFTGKPDIAQCFFVIFIIKPEFENLNFYESKWYRILNAKININKMILPCI